MRRGTYCDDYEISQADVVHNHDTVQSSACFPRWEDCRIYMGTSKGHNSRDSGEKGGEVIPGTELNSFLLRKVLI